MPFIDPESRHSIDILGHKPVTPGDRCYVHYRRDMDEWKASPRWTTFDGMARNLFPDDEKRAEFLALLVFFVWHVCDYEVEKESDNGGIE